MWIEFTSGGEASGINALIEAWDAKGGSTIEHRPIGNEEFFTVIRTGLASGEPPDILQYEGYQQTRDFAAEGQLTDLTDWWAEHKDRFDLAAIMAWTAGTSTVRCPRSYPTIAPSGTSSLYPNRMAAKPYMK